LLDEIARFMLRKDSDFIRLDISSSHRRQIRNLVEQHRKQELTLMREIHAEQRSADTDKSLSSRLKQLVKLPNKS